MGSVRRNPNLIDLAMDWRNDTFLQERNRRIFIELENEMFEELRSENRSLINQTYSLSRRYMTNAFIKSNINEIERQIFKANLAQSNNNKINESAARNLINEKCVEVIMFINTNF